MTGDGEATGLTQSVNNNTNHMSNDSYAVGVVVKGSGGGEEGCMINDDGTHQSKTVYEEGDYEESPASQGGLAGLANKIMPHGGILASCFSFCAASMGAGTLGLPAAMKAAGSVNGSLMLILVCASTIYSMRLLAITVESTGYQTYEQMARGFVGKWFERFTAFLIVAFCWGCSVAYVVTVNDVMSKINKASWFPTVFTSEAGQRGLTSIYWGLIMLPLSLAREINALRYASALGVCSTIFLVSSILAHSVDAGPQVAKKNLTYFEFDISMVVALPTFIFSYCCQTNAFEIYTEMKPRTVKQMTKNGTMSLVVCTCIYIIAGVSGFANFGAEVRGNILNNLDPLESAYVAVAFFAVTITVTAAFPIVIFPTRDAVLQVIGYESAYNCPTWVRILVCAVLAVCSLICGLFVPNISICFGILGGICGSSLAFILPAVFYMKGGVEGGKFTIESAGLGNFICTWLMLVVGVIAGLLGTAVSLWQTITGQS